MACDVPDEDHNGCYVEEGGGGFDGRVGILPEPAVAADPGEEAFDQPASRLDGKADLIGLSLQDLDGD